MPQDAYARSRSFKQREAAAQKLRTALGCVDTEPMPPIQVALSTYGLIPLLRSMVSMGNAKACAFPDSGDIHVREDVMPAIVEDSPYARWLICHELVHTNFHEAGPKYFKMATGNVLFPFLHEDESAEHQADQIADAVLMPIEMVNRCRTTKELAQVSRAPIDRAVERFKAVIVLRSNHPSASTELEIRKLRMLAATTEADRRKAEREFLKQALWNALPTIPFEDPAVCRNCGGYRIVWGEYSRMTQCGWRVEGERIVAYFQEQGR